MQAFLPFAREIVHYAGKKKGDRAPKPSAIILWEYRRGNPFRFGETERGSLYRFYKRDPAARGMDKAVRLYHAPWDPVLCVFSGRDRKSGRGNSPSTAALFPDSPWRKTLAPI